MDIIRKKTNEEFINQVYELVGDEYIYLEEYKGADIKILCLHNVCGHMWYIRPRSFLEGQRCPVCSKKNAGINKRKTNEDFTKEVYSLVDEEYIFLEQYKGSQEKILCKHNIKECMHEWYISPNNFLQGQRCPQCMRANYNRDTVQFKKEVFDLTGNDYVVLGEYVDAKTKLLIKHSECGYEWETTPDTFFKGCRCPKCSMQAKRKTDKGFVKEVYELVGNEYIFLEQYKGSNKKIKCKHNIEDCGHEWRTPPYRFLQGKRCPECYGNKRKTNKEFTQEVYDLVGNEYKFLEEYINNATKIKCRHNNCGHVWDITPSSFLASPRCPQCSESKGEQRIRQYLESLDIKFQQEYSFDGLVGVNGGLLRFDFAIFNSINNIKLLIEYDGEFHYKKYYEEQNFEDIQVHDQRKNQYCKENNIPLLRIPYWDFDNIEDILFKTLSDMEVK